MAETIDRETVEDIHAYIRDYLAGRSQGDRDEATKPETYRRLVMERLTARGITVEDLHVVDRLALDAYNKISPGRLGGLEPLLAHPDVTEIMVNGPDEVWYEAKGTIRRATSVSLGTDADVRALITRIVSADNKLCDEAHPMCDCVLHRPGEACDQSRVNTVVPPISVDHPLIDIRKFRKDVTRLEELMRLGTLDADMARLLDALVRARMNVLVVGGTGTGKTTLLNAMSRLIPDTERIITIEDTPELSIDKPQVVRMTSRDANAEGAGEVTIRRLVKNALRQRPDRIIVGECRSDETMEMLQAMSTGHDGSLSTVHANGCRDALDRLNVMVHYGSDLSEHIVKQIIASAIDFVVALDRDSAGVRRIVDISEVQAYTPTSDVITMAPIWGWSPQTGEFAPTGQVPSQAAMKKFSDAGVDVSPRWFRR